MKKMNSLYFLIKLSESDKRVLIALCLVLIILLVLFGYLVKLIKYILSKKADYVDNSMYDLLDANVITDKKHFRKVSWEKNRRKFYFESRIPVFFLILSLFILFLYLCIAGFDVAFIGEYNSKLLFKLDWSNCGELLLGFIPALARWPKIVQSPVFYFNKIDAWITYIFDIGIIYSSIHFIICSTFFLARNFRTISVSNSYFKKDLNALKEAKLNARSTHIKEPSDEMKKMIKEES